MIACGACGRKYARGQSHSCATAAWEAERERLAGEPPEPWDDEDLDLARQRGGVLGREELSTETLWRALHPRPDPDRGPPLHGDLSYYRDDTGFANGTDGQHWCLCDRCHSCLQPLLKLRYLGNIERHSLQLRTILTEEQAADWRPDVDGCDACGWPPAGQPRSRRGPSELFAILYGLEAYYEAPDPTS